ncbi:hypothetical protein K8R30_02010 [archaeon]|nr:hypothetical protein [archaeon]
MNDDFNFEGKKLYERDGICIYKGNAPDTHDVVIKGKYLFLDRDMRRDWLSRGIDGVREGYGCFTSPIESGNLESDFEISACELAFALSQSEIREMKDEINNLLDTIQPKSHSKNRHRE